MGIKAIAKLAPVHVVYTISAGGASSTTLDVGVAASGTAPASLTTALSAALALDSTANTPVQSTLTSTAANRLLDRGEQLALNYTGTVTAYEGAVHIVLRPVRTNTTY